LPEGRGGESSKKVSGGGGKKKKEAETENLRFEARKEEKGKESFGGKERGKGTYFLLASQERKEGSFKTDTPSKKRKKKEGGKAQLIPPLGRKGGGSTFLP